MPDLRAALQRALDGRYRLERELGHGGMAIVYLGEDLEVPRRVAIKVLRPELAGVVARERFLREIRIASSLVHPNILPLLEAGTAPATAATPALPYFTMPFVEGESLRDRLKREPQLPLEDALRITREVAAALGYAHDHDVVHRDIKPENILLVQGHAIVADFGIARAISESVNADAITSAGLVVGTSMYMAPEQAAGSAKLDGRSDLYALGCVLYEMLGGEPPFSGASAQAIIARHQLDPIPSLRTLRSTVPIRVEATVMRALAKSPADRFQTAAKFAAAATADATGDSTAPAPTPGWWSGRREWVVLAIAAVVAIVAYALGADGRWGLSGASQAGALDTTRYAIVSFSEDSGVPQTLRPALLLQDALSRWEGVQLVDPFQVREAIARRDTSGFSREDWDRLASQLGAGRYVRGYAALLGDSIRIHAVLYRTVPRSADPVVSERTVSIASDLSGRERAFAALAEGLLVRTGATGGALPAGRTTSLPARQAFEAGTIDIDAWDLRGADSNFAAATRYDPAYAQAHLWLALVRSWENPKESATWRSSAERANAGRNDLTPRDRQIAAAILAQARGDLLAACRHWGELTEKNEYDFVVWYGRATCLSQDRTVVRDARSPTGWRFRSSYHGALEAYSHAYRLLPPILGGFRSESYGGMVDVLYAGSNAFRRGAGTPPDPVTFYAFPSWAGDSLVFYPVPLGADGVIPGSPVATIAEAIRHQRERMHDIARGWVAEYPGSADALVALAISLQLLGDRSALDTLAKARRLTKTPGETIRVATSEIWMRVLFSTPSGESELRSARRLADSLLASAPGDGSIEPMLLASLAALTGRAHLAARLGRAIDPKERPDTPPPLVGLGITFQTYAAMGGPVDSLGPLAQRVIEALATPMSEETLHRAREMWLELPILVGFPAYQFPQVGGLTHGGEGLLAADAAFLRGDTTAAWQALAPTPRDRSTAAAVESTMDLGFARAWLLATLGRSDSAAAYLDAVLGALPKAQPQFFLSVYQAGPLMRAMALRAQLAAEAGDTAIAQAWAAAVVTFWSDADPFLQPVVKQMAMLTR